MLQVVILMIYKQCYEETKYQQITQMNKHDPAPCRDRRRAVYGTWYKPHTFRHTNITSHIKSRSIIATRKIADMSEYFILLSDIFQMNIPLFCQKKKKTVAVIDTPNLLNFNKTLQRKKNIINST